MSNLQKRKRARCAHDQNTAKGLTAAKCLTLPWSPNVTFPRFTNRTPGGAGGGGARLRFMASNAQEQIETHDARKAAKTTPF